MKNLKIIRENKKLKQWQVAEKIGVSRTTYTKYETGDSEPDILTLTKIADIFETSIDEIVGYTPKTTKGFSITEKELELIEKYRKNKSMQEAINKLLEIDNTKNEIRLPQTKKQKEFIKQKS